MYLRAQPPLRMHLPYRPSIAVDGGRWPSLRSPLCVQLRRLQRSSLRLRRARYRQTLRKLGEGTADYVFINRQDECFCGTI
jgi:hypothetical protein